MKMNADISVEGKKTELIKLQIENEKKIADSKGYYLEKTLKPYKEMDWKILAAIGSKQNASDNIAFAFRELAENAGKIGTLNITPELLDTILKTDKNPKK